jgi:hypothetical protein
MNFFTIRTEIVKESRILDNGLNRCIEDWIEPFISAVWNYFFLSTREGHEKVVSLLLENGADVELPDNYGQSPLFMACWKGELIVEYQ